MNSFTLIDNVGLPEQFEVRISGGGAKSPIWQQIIADIFGAPLVNVNTPEAGAFGAALLSAVGVEAFADVASACSATITTGERVEPSENLTIYAEIYQQYTKLYPTLKEVFHQLA